MTRYLADTNALIWWLTDHKQLSKEQLRVLKALENQGQPLFVSAVTLLEVAILFGVGNRKHPERGAQMLSDMEIGFGVEVLPMSFEVAIEVASVGDALRDPMDRAIVATARVHRLTLITSDERIIKSKLVRVVD